MPAPAAAPAKTAASKACDPVLDPKCAGNDDDDAQEVGPKLSQDKVLAVIKEGLPLIEECGKQFNTSGTVKMSWKIDVEGNPSAIRVIDPKFANRPIAGCLIKQVKSWKFPKNPGGSATPVSLPFRLKE